MSNKFLIVSTIIISELQVCLASNQQEDLSRLWPSYGSPEEESSDSDEYTRDTSTLERSRRQAEEPIAAESLMPEGPSTLPRQADVGVQHVPAAETSADRVSDEGTSAIIRSLIRHFPGFCLGLDRVMRRVSHYITAILDEYNEHCSPMTAEPFEIGANADVFAGSDLFASLFPAEESDASDLPISRSMNFAEFYSLDYAETGPWRGRYDGTASRYRGATERYFESDPNVRWINEEGEYEDTHDSDFSPHLFETPEYIARGWGASREVNFMEDCARIVDTNDTTDMSIPALSDVARERGREYFAPPPYPNDYESTAWNGGPAYTLSIDQQQVIYARLEYFQELINRQVEHFVEIDRRVEHLERLLEMHMERFSQVVSRLDRQEQQDAQNSGQ
ncbi:MAG: hypothetical protein LBQ43_02920 [Holosporales bacterium]|jgi:hypothetical protein|nr:hypothetical protein [Holosporales bacterium]